MKKFYARMVKNDYYWDCQFLQLSDAGLATSHGLEQIALDIMTKKTGLRRDKLEGIIVYNGHQLCFCPDKEMFEESKSKKWLRSCFSVTKSGQVVALVDPDKCNENYVVEVEYI